MVRHSLIVRKKVDRKWALSMNGTDACQHHCVAVLQGLLRKYAPVCLKAYYDKDARKSFCQPQLWTEPYNNLMARLSQQQQQQQDGSVLATTAAVVQALLASTGLAAAQDEEGGNSSSGMSPTGTTRTSGSQSASMQQSPAAAAAAVAARGAHLPGLRTSALLSLLKAAPQCVPFGVRLELFRQMIEQDKVCRVRNCSVSGSWRIGRLTGLYTAYQPR
jgi:hypothetical protein